MSDTVHITQSASDDLRQLHRLELISRIEAFTLLFLLIIAVPLKHWGGWSLGVKVMGPIHGIAFCIYLWTVIQTASGSDWRAGETVKMMVLAILPAGGFLNASIISRKIKQLRSTANL
ncbi:DUF3817 domain-containing protein [Herbaspirillum sp. VT-16-41]|uniref:DUF3817 domain-containing protein n=1 Tax=Herbaspirillum sp. VT-16-41 TaxID=1953765 RepID=UPI0009C9C218|nr:DUF3817 domain-containing protein [Herbaspirillum sp. VT-16-41]ONN64954.1 hypothetical protein BTM36_19205 [Herbaspirillum sp. VT-16-41]